jgi:hypothetical protein
MKAPAQALIERYRCPESFLKFRLQGPLNDEPGFFQFGSGITCYGRLSAGKGARRATPPLHDVSSDVVVEKSELVLPFDPTEVIDNLLRESYVSSAPLLRSFGKDAYYALRPLLSQGMRRAIQRARARNWRDLRFPHWPVDTTVEDLCGSLMSLSIEALKIDKIPFIWFWPDGAPGCVLMTHDVETEAGRDFCSTLMEIDGAFGLKAAFQIVPEGRYAVPLALLAQIRDQGFEVGVQDLNHDGRLYDDWNEFLRRAEKINRYGRAWEAKGFRAAVLYRKPDWFSKLDFAFDMSIPNVAHLDPQPGGCCTVFPYFIGDMLELPLTTIQDYMLLNLLDQASIDLWKSQFDLIAEKNGLASFIIHPDYIALPKARSMYEALLGYLRDFAVRNQVWFALPSAIDEWWRARSKMNLVHDGGGWRIEGEGANRAVLAYARSEGNRLVYDLEVAAA